MTEETEGPILRILQDIRSDQRDRSGRLIRLERHMEELRETMLAAAGMAVHAGTAAEGHASRLDGIEDRLAAPQRRVDALEENR